MMAALRRIRFGTVALLLVVATFGLLTRVACSHLLRKQAVLARLAKASAALSFDYEWGPGHTWRHDATPPGNRLMKSVFGEHYASEVVEVQVFPNATLQGGDTHSFDDNLAVGVSHFEKITWIVLYDTEVSDIGLLQLARVNDLERVDLEGSPRITTRGVQEFRRVRPDVRLHWDGE